jgi:tRNA (guanine37-N1)-methyltransferase
VKNCQSYMTISQTQLTLANLANGSLPPTAVRFDILTLFPDFFTSPLSSGLVAKAIARHIATVHLTNPRDFTTDKHHKVDDEPYGGGVGMLIKPEPLFAAIESVPVLPRREVIFMTPQGQTMSQPLFQELATYDQLVILCGHYEGIDERVLHSVTREVSLGDFVLTCGEIPALTLLNGVMRLLPGTVAKEESLKLESFESGLLDYPQYTRPAEFRGWKVPDVLLSGNHGAIARWRKQQQMQRTRDRRPDLWAAWLKENPDIDPSDL